MSESPTYLPPQNLEMEQAVIGCVLQSDRAREAVEATGLKASDFYRESHQQIWEAVQIATERGNGVDELTVAAVLEDRGTLKQIGGSVALMSLTQTVPAVANAKAYAKEVVHQSRRRWLTQTGTAIAKLGYDQQSGDDTEALLNKANELMAGLVDSEVGGFVTVDEVLPSLFDTWTERFTNGVRRTGLTTGFKSLDVKLGGFQPRSFNVIAARPGMGKTSLVTNIAVNAAFDEGVHSAIFSLEMDSEDITTRIMSGLARVPAARLKLRAPIEQDFERLGAAAQRIATDAPRRIHIDQSPDVTPFQVRDRCRRLDRKLRRRKQRLGLVVVDYLQLMESGRKVENRNLDVSAISRQLKLLAMELRCPVIALSQLSRGLESRSDKRPVLSDLRDSGSIEQDADTVTFIFRPDAYGPVDTELKGLAEIIIAKNRHGEMCTVGLNWLSEYTLFTERGAA